MRVDAPRDALGQGCGAKAVGQADHAEIIDDRIQYRIGQVMEGGIAFRTGGQISKARGAWVSLQANNWR